jgi:hypothetical protein
MNSKKQKIDLKDCLENVLLSDVEKWKKNNLPENKLLKRIKILKTTNKKNKILNTLTWRVLSF